MFVLKIAMALLGLLMVIGGMQLGAFPVLTYASAIPLLGALLAASGITSVVLWFMRKKKNDGKANIWTLIGAILTAVVGLVVLLDLFAQIELSAVLPYLIAGWVIANGVFLLVSAYNLHRLKKSGLDTEAPVGVPLVMGILMMILGIMLAANPLLGILSLGTWIAIEVIFAGISLITFALLD